MSYVDDISSLVDNHFNISTILQIVNPIDPYNQFNFELGNCNNFLLLDVLVTRCNNFFKTFVYRKTFSGFNTPHAQSNFQAKQERGIFHTYVNHAIKIRKNSTSFNDEFNYLKPIAVKK